MITREEIINHIMAMKNGTDKTTPQPGCARAALAQYVEWFPDWDLNQGVKDAMGDAIGKQS